MLRERHHIIYILLLTAFFALMFMLLSMFLSTPLEAADVKKHEAHPIIQPPPATQQTRAPEKHATPLPGPESKIITPNHSPQIKLEKRPRHKHSGKTIFFYGDEYYFPEPIENAEALPYLEESNTPLIEDHKDTDLDNRFAMAESSGEIYLDANEINNARLQQLSKIQVLDLTVANCDDATFQRLLDLTNLVSLKIQGGKISCIPEGISRLSNLEWLDISGGNLTSLPPEIGKLKNLEQLVLNKNKLKNIPPQIGELNNLNGLYISGNQIESLPPSITRLTNLRALDLSENPPSILNSEGIKNWLNGLIARQARVRI